MLSISWGGVEGHVWEFVMRVRRSCETGLRGCGWFPNNISKKVSFIQKSNNVYFAIIRDASVFWINSDFLEKSGIGV